MSSLNEIHVCSREDCPTINISGIMIHCFVCKGNYFAKCFGIDDSVYDALAPRSIFAEDSNIQFVCPKCLKRPNHGVSVSKPIEQDVKAIKLKLDRVLEQHEKMDEKLASINVACKNIDVGLKVRRSTPSFADVVRKSNSNISPPILTQASKRPRVEPIAPANAANRPVQRSTARTGASDAVIGPGIPEGVQGVPSQRRFDKSVWVSRFHTDTTADQVLDFVCSITGCDDKSKFFCKKLVKRDADLSQLRFVSFKIDVDQKYFERVADPGIWPKYILVREFFNERRTVPISLSSNRQQFPNLLQIPSYAPVERTAVVQTANEVSQPALLNQTIDLISMDGDDSAASTSNTAN